MESLLVISLWLFALTHIDTLVILVVFCADERYDLPEVLLGHYAGFSIGLAGALVGSAIAAETLRESSFLLGVVPLALGVWGIVRRDPSRTAESSIVPAGRLRRAGIVTSAGVGLSGENIAVFVPFFASLSQTELFVVNLLYLVAAGLTFVVALVVARRTTAVGLPDWVDRWAAPITLTVVGLYVLSAGWIAG